MRISSHGPWLGDLVHGIDERLVEPLKRLEAAAAAEIRVLESRLVDLEQRAARSIETLERRVRILCVMIALLAAAHVVHYLESWISALRWLGSTLRHSKLPSAVISTYLSLVKRTHSRAVN